MECVRGLGTGRLPPPSPPSKARLASDWLENRTVPGSEREAGSVPPALKYSNHSLSDGETKHSFVL